MTMLMDEAQRQTWLAQHITRIDGQAPTSSVAKHKKMALSPFVFYRGSSQLFYADWAQGHILLPHGWDTLPQTTVMGDCHISNFGFLTEEGAHGDTVVFAINDFDDACIGNVLWDLQRLASSVVLAAEHCAGVINGTYQDPDMLGKVCVNDADCDKALTELYRGYCAILHESLNGQSQSQAMYSDFVTPSALPKLYRKACKRSFGGKHFLTKSTFAKAVQTDELPLRFKAPHPKFAPLDDATKAELIAGFAPYFQDTVLDVVARLDAGTGSVNMSRFYFLVGPDTKDHARALQETCVVEVKQQREAAAIYYFPNASPQNALNPAHLTVMCQRRMQRRPDLILDEAVWRDKHWLIRSRHHAKVGVDPADICCGEVNTAQGGFAHYAYACGQALALGHIRGDRRSTYNEQSWLAFIDQHASQLQQSAWQYSDQVKKDWMLFVQLLMQCK